MIGTTRSRVSFFMNKFRKLGFIEYNGGLYVHSSLLNIDSRKVHLLSRRVKTVQETIGNRHWGRSC